LTFWLGRAIITHTQQKGAQMLHTFTVNAVNTPAKAKLVFNKKLGTIKVVVAFNVHKKYNKNNELVHAFPVQAKCAYVSGDVDATEVLQTLQNASKILNTNNIQVVE
jgi:hypothetical protein